MQIFKKEKAVRKLALEHAAMVAQCLRATEQAVQRYLAGREEDFQHSVRRVARSESKADNLKRETWDVLNSGAFLPTIRADVYRLIEAVDHVAGEGEDTARFLADQSPGIPDAFHPALTDLLALNLACFDELLAALEQYFRPQGELDELTAHVARVGKLESEVDHRQVELTQAVFASDLSLGERIHLGQLLKTLCAISDSAEKVSDELKFAALKSVV
jgi:predicted phosphate transport protein (TIGR00153 family)